MKPSIIYQFKQTKKSLRIDYLQDNQSKDICLKIQSNQQATDRGELIHLLSGTAVEHSHKWESDD